MCGDRARCTGLRESKKLRNELGRMCGAFIEPGWIATDDVASTMSREDPSCPPEVWISTDAADCSFTCLATRSIMIAWGGWRHDCRPAQDDTRAGRRKTGSENARLATAPTQSLRLGWRTIYSSPSPEKPRNLSKGTRRTMNPQIAVQESSKVRTFVRKKMTTLGHLGHGPPKLSTRGMHHNVRRWRSACRICVRQYVAPTETDAMA